MTELLNLSTIVERPTVNITSKKHPNGKQYELVNLADLGPYEYAIILQRDGELAKLRTVKNPTAAHRRKMKKMLADSVKLLVPSIEDAVLADLTEQQQQMIILTWGVHVNETADAGAAEGKAPSRRTTAGSSPGSKRSTAATRKRGSTSQRG